MSLNFDDFKKQDINLIFQVKNACDEVLKIKGFDTLGIPNFHAIPMNMVPGDEDSIKGHNVRGVYWTKLESGKEVSKNKPIDETKYTELVNDFKKTYF